MLHKCTTPFVSNAREKFFRTFFLKGCASSPKLHTPLSVDEQQKLLGFVKEDPYANSFMVYNPEGVAQQLRNWRERLPWIKPHYAIKSNPIELLL